MVRADKPAPLSPQTLKLPSGPSSLKGLGESFSADAASGSGSFTVPIEVAPGALAPVVQLQYTGGNGKSEAGTGWRLSRFRIYRTTDKGLPRFDERDRFAVEGPGLNDELVLVDPVARYYRLKNEGAFALFIRDAARDDWTVRLKNGESAHLGKTAQARDANPRGSYRWYVERHEDRFGHSTEYDYTVDRGRRYLAAVRYQLHAAPDFHNRVVFAYEPRPDVFTDYTYGYAETTALRLKTIEVFHGARKLRVYTASYQQGLLTSLLASVQMQGENGLRMPALSFAYVPHSSQGRLVTMRSPPPLEGLSNGEATLEDVNGDALPDLLVGTAGDYRYYENLDGLEWSQAPLGVEGDPEVSLWEPGVLLLDADGDGFRDVLYPHYNAFRYAAGGKIQDGVFRGFGEPVTLEPQSLWQFDWTSSQVKVSDLDFDGRIDLLFQRPGALTQILNTATRQLEESVLPELPVDVDFGDPRVQMLDFNGDGVLDFVRTEIGYDQGRIRVWYGRGFGQYAAEQTMRGVPTGEASEFHLQDVNGDGQTDLLRVSGSWVVYHLNDGYGMFTTAKGDYRGLPPTYQTVKLLFADMNGNGTTDVVWLTTEHQLVYLDLLASPFFGHLARIDNGMGAVTTITYRSSTDYLIQAKRAGRPWRTPLVRPVPVIAELRVSDSLDALGLRPNESVTTYDYRDGYYDTQEREFRGFGEVAITKAGNTFHETQVTRTWFHVGRNLVTAADEEILKGKPYRQVVTDEGGRVLASTETQWERRWLCQEDLGSVLALVLPRCSRYGDKQAAKDELVALGVEVGVLQGTWERTATPRFVYSTSAYDVWGNQTGKAAYGEVRFSLGHAVGQAFGFEQLDTTVGADEVVTATQLINRAGPDRWLIGLPYRTDHLDTAGTLLKSTRTYYDGPAFEGLGLGEAERGKVTREEAWLADEQGERWIRVTRNRYDPDGLLVETRDALGSRREYGYDAETRTFLTLERVHVESGALDYTAAYDRGRGAVTSATDFNGNTTLFDFDGLGRLTAVVGPRDSTDRQLHRYAYEFGTPEHPISTTAIEALVDREQGRYVRSWVYSDGLGRTRLTKSEAEAPHSFIGSGWQELSPQGAATHAYESFASATRAFEPAPASAAVTLSYFDAQGRVVMNYPPQVGAVATYTATTYLPFETRIYDELDTSESNWLYPAVTRVDGQGRVVEIVKYNDYDGRFTELRWTVSYDPLGNVLRIVDPQLEERTYTYDTLSRRRHIVDPNAGTVDFAYDDAGNLIRRANALGEQVTADYGLANRLLATHLWRPGAAAPEVTYEYHYDSDTGSAALSGATNLRGQLAWVADPVGSMSWSYDELGRVVAVGRVLWDPARSSYEAQARDVYRADFTLDPQGKVLAASYPGGFEVSYTYNVRNLVESITGGFGVSPPALVPRRAYDANGGVLRTDFANATTSCTWYDRRRRVIARKAARSAADACLSPDATDASALQHLAYTYTPHGLIAVIGDRTAPKPHTPRLDVTYAYDRLYELTSARTPEGQLAYRYDTIQNLIEQSASWSFSALPLGAFEYGAGGAGPNALTSAGGEHFAYDAAGRLLGYQRFGLFYDAQDRLVEARRADGTSIRNYYDFAGERVIEVEARPGEPAVIHRYVFDDFQVHGSEPTWIVSAGEQKLVEVSETAGLVPSLYILDELVAYSLDPTRRPKPAAVELLDLDRDGDAVDAGDLAVATRRYLGEAPAGPPVRVWRYYHADHLGAPTHVTDWTGQPNAAGDWSSFTRFHPYGPVFSQAGDQPAYGFAGILREPAAELGLVRMGARWYAPKIGRWVTPDPLFLENPAKGAEKPLNLSLYAYAANSPAVFYDREGREPKANWDAAQKAQVIQVLSNENLSNREIVTKYDPTFTGSSLRPSLRELPPGSTSVYQLEASTTFGGPTDIDWALTLAHVESETMVPASVAYPIGKAAWSVVDAISEAITTEGGLMTRLERGFETLKWHLGTFYSEQEERAIDMAAALTKEDVPLRDMLAPAKVATE